MKNPNSSWRLLIAFWILTGLGYGQDIIHSGESVFTIKVLGNTSFRGSYLAVSGAGGSKTVKIEGAGSAAFTVAAAQLYLTVQKQTESGQIGVELSKGGVTVKRESTDAPYGVVGLATTLPAGGLPQQTTFEVTGSAKFAFLTLMSGTGETRQEQVELPYSLEFFPKVGWIVGVTAQKRRVTRPDPFSKKGEVLVLADGVQGTLHVAIRVSGRILGEEETTQPFGVASAAVRLP
ncbi:MAG: hypothetical protein ABI824_05835 [Acidobacteriota bacterium]